MEGRAGDRDRGDDAPQDIGTEVFFLPAAAHTEKSGSFTNTQRLLQWHHQAVEPAGDARSDLWFTYHLGRRIREKLAASAPTRPTGRSWISPGTTRPRARWRSRTRDAVLAEINGWDADGKPLSAYTQLNERRVHRLRLLDLLRRATPTG